MAVLDDIKTFAGKVDVFTSKVSDFIDKETAAIKALQAQIAAGTIQPADLSAALDPVVAHLTTVSTALDAAAAGGTTVLPPL